MNHEAEDYIREHSSSEDPLLNELYRFTHLHAVNPNMVSGHLQGLFLEFLVSISKPLLALEIGTYTGYSAISIARALPADGLLHTIDVNDELSEISSGFFKRAGVAGRIVSHTGRAQDIVPALNLKFDFVFIDGDKREYSEYYKLATEHLSPEGIIIADNVLWGGKASESDSRDPQTMGIIEFNSMVKADARVEKVILPIRDGMTLIRKKRCSV
jgi:predicted O-methyltransferase YrrM